MMLGPLILLLAQETPALPAPATPAKQVIENTGKPMRVPYTCTEQDIQSFGMTCTAIDPCPIFLQVAGIETVGARIFLTGNLHNGAATMYSMLLSSGDEGKTWSEPHERIRSAGLEQIRFIDFENGWISGQTLAAFPRDPFFLISTDGGKSWRQRPVFDEGKVGSIEQFWFQSRTQGSLVLDRTMAPETGGRYEIYETMTGGDTWMIREVSARPLRIKAPEAGNPDWRVRSEATTKSHRVERKQGQRWQTVAAFLVQAGECKPEDKPLVEPPEPQPAPEVKHPTAQPVKPPTMKKRPQ